jgi:hypothetical protein
MNAYKEINIQGFTSHGDKSVGRERPNRKTTELA